MQYSTNFNMNKPELNEQYRLEHWNKNTDIIDSAIQAEIDTRTSQVNTLTQNLSNGIIEAKNLDNATGILAVAKGGTGSSTVAEARTNLGLGSVAVKTAGSAVGNVPLVGTALGTTDGQLVSTNSSGELKPSGDTIASLKTYIKNQNALSALEIVTISTDSSAPTTMSYDGFLIFNYGFDKEGWNAWRVYVNDTSFRQFMESDISTGGEGQFTIPVKKGDEIYYVENNTYKQTKFYGRFYKSRDYS